MQRRLRDAIQLSRGSRPWLFESPLAGTKHDARHLGQQVGPAARDLPQLGDRRAGLGLGQLTPLGVPPGSPPGSPPSSAAIGRSGSGPWRSRPILWGFQNSAARLGLGFYVVSVRSMLISW
jgi:hypothetical protein